MTIREFTNYMTAIINGIDSGDNHHRENDDKVFNQHGRWALNRLERICCDRRQNIRRWLNGKNCVFISDKTGKQVDIDIGRDIEALYYFLAFCQRINKGIEIDEDFRDYLATVITRSCSAEAWDEC